ncbi:hypothetical protein ADIARSV_1457 [Arcticibacter svalbardensis MN12-7]|uniref:Uncharacterized protein n=1 Tax=Arcticibacter svalbardensis MN12-7 TaxID=1150600 RepID=R9GUZ2_9SPHI|nr:hypothetical protein [Arcticibacter svalbardensis]EOR95345.1 hypothetical protein ADIARSV_1457 [Arcticibacter svalbardensis MN12-7]
MEVFEIWKLAMKALPTALSAEFSKPKISLTKDKDSGTIHWYFKNILMGNKLVIFPQVTHNLIPLVEQFASGNQTQNQKTFLMTRIVYPKIGEKLIEAGINFIDASGNMFIDQNGVYLMRLGAKEIETKKRRPKAGCLENQG